MLFALVHHARFRKLLEISIMLQKSQIYAQPDLRLRSSQLFALVHHARFRKLLEISIMLQKSAIYAQLDLRLGSSELFALVHHARFRISRFSKSNLCVGLHHPPAGGKLS